MRIKKTSNQIPVDIDPRLQEIIEKYQLKQKNLATTIEEEPLEVPVIAKVTDVEEWRALPGVRHDMEISLAPDKAGRIVTAQVSVSELPKIRQSPVVLSLKASQPLKQLLKDTTNEILADPNLLPSEVNGGEGVIVGIVDHGCDFVHQNFRRSDGTTRLLALWDQWHKSSPKGKVFKKEEINKALKVSNPYRTLGYSVPRESHGTHVMDIAAGNGHGTGIPGVAPNADLIFVEPNYSDTEGESEPHEIVGKNFGHSKNLLEAIRFIFDQAGNEPCVVNVSLGTNGGPHDGTSLVEQGIDGMLLEQSNRAVVIAAGNSYTDNIHATDTVQQGEFTDLQWNIPKNDFTYNELEIWYDKADIFSLELLTPDGNSIGSVELGSNGEVIGDNGEKLIFIAHRRQDPNNGDNMIGVFLESGLWEGIWTLRLHGIKVTNGKFHAWIERDNRLGRNNQSTFTSLNDNTHTLGSICCGQMSIVVGSYDAKSHNTPISWFSSAGPTRDGRQKPEVSAPGGTAPPEELKVEAAASRSLNGTTRMMGTSMAAPAVTGVIALMLAEAKACGLSLTIQQIHNILKQTARVNPSTEEDWNNRYGYGRVNAKAAVSAVAAMAETNKPVEIPAHAVQEGEEIKDPLVYQN